MMSTWSRLFVGCGVFQGGDDTVALRRIIVDKVGDFEDAAVRPFDEVESPVSASFPCQVPSASHDFVGLAQLVLSALARVDVGDVDDGFLVGVEHLHDGVECSGRSRR